MFLVHDKPVPADTQRLLDAVAWLDISEFRLFELAYHKWYGRPACRDRLEADFVHYMFDGDIPFWVRDYVRGVHESAALPQQADYPSPPADQSVTRAGIRRGLRVLLGLIFLLVFLIVISSHAPEWMQFGDECYFPPCY